MVELQPDARALRRQIRRFRWRSRTSLHTKALVLDRREVFVGSFNLDPRSLHLNTEMGYYVASPELGEQLAALVEEGLAPENSYRLSRLRGRLRWTGDRGQVFEHEPLARWRRRMLSWWLSWLPIERFL